MRVILTNEKRITGELVRELALSKEEQIKDIFDIAVDLIKNSERITEKMEQLTATLIALIPANKPVFPHSLYARLSMLITSLQISARKDQWGLSVDRATGVVKHFPCMDDVYTGHCPDCGAPLVRFGHRDRGVINEAGEKEVYDLRRLRCKHCGRVHIELLDLMVPYHRHSAVVVEAALDGSTDHLPGSQISEWNISRLRRRFADMGSVLIKEAPRPVRDRLAAVRAFCGGGRGWLTVLVYRLVGARRWQIPEKLCVGAGKPLRKK